MSREYLGRNYLHIFQRAVIAVSLNLLDFVDGVHARNDAAEHCVGAVEMWCAAFTHIKVALFGGEVGRVIGGEPFGLHCQLLAQSFQSGPGRGCGAWP